MKNKKVSVDGLADTIIKELREYNQDITDGLKKEVQDASTLCRKELKATSPKLTGSYAKGWRKKTAYESQTDIRVEVYNATDYQLTHLLEHGHALVGHNGKVLGTVGAIPHIGPAEQKAEKQLLKKVDIVVRGGKT